MTLFEEATQRFEEAALEYHRYVYSGGKQDGAKRAKLQERYDRTRKAVLEYVTTLEMARAASVMIPKRIPHPDRAAVYRPGSATNERLRKSVEASMVEGADILSASGTSAMLGIRWCRDNGYGWQLTAAADETFYMLKRGVQEEKFTNKACPDCLKAPGMICEMHAAGIAAMGGFDEQA